MTEEKKTETPQPPPSTPTPGTRTEESPIPEYMRDGKILGKFAGEPELVDAYKEMEQLLRQKGMMPGEAKADAEPEREEPKPQPKAAESRKDLEIGAKPEKPKDLLAPYMEEFAKTGEISEKSRAELAEHGITSKFIDDHLAMRAKAEKQSMNEIAELAGGLETYKAMAEWAKGAMSADELDAYNMTMRSGSEGQIRFAVQGLYARYQAAGNAPRVEGKTSATIARGGFRSEHEALSAMSDVRYTTDPDYRAEVEAKLKRSEVFGFGRG